MSKRKPELKLVEDTGSELLSEEFVPEPPPQQGEMPFALVEGQPMTELPRDLYIPPDALQVFLEAFEGPLDLLLYLIRKQNLDILDIPIAEITRQYMKYIDVMADLQLELAGEYLLMAAMLAEIKSRMLLPRPPSAEGQEEDDPRAELVRRLQEYERFKKAAEDIDKLARLERDTMPASAELQERKVVTLQPDVTLKEMLDAFKDVLARAEKFAHHHISRERLSQRARMSEILDRLQTQAFFEFTQLFRPEEGRMGVTVTFIAILELMKEGLIEIVQAEAYAPIHVRAAQRHLKVVAANAAVAASADADAENAAALAQPELEGENDVEDEVELPAEAAQPEDAAVEGALAEAAAVAAALGVDDVVIGDAAAAETVAIGDDLAVTTLPTGELTAEAAEPVVVADVLDAEQPATDVTVAETSSEQEPVVVALDAAVVEVDEVVAGDAAQSAESIVTDDLSVTTPAIDELSSAVAEPVVVADAEQHVSEVSAAPETVDQEPIVVALDTATSDSQEQFAGETSEALAADESPESAIAAAAESIAADSQNNFASETSDALAVGSQTQFSEDASVETGETDAVVVEVDEVVAGDAAQSAESIVTDDLSVTTPPIDELSSAVAEPVVVADAEQQVSEVSAVPETVDQEPIVVALDTATSDSQEQFAGETSEALAADESHESAATESIAADSQNNFASETRDALAVSSQTQFSEDPSEAFAAHESQEAGAAVGNTAEDTAADLQNQLASETYDPRATDEVQESDAGGTIEAVSADSHDQFAGETSDALAAETSHESATAVTADAIAVGSQNQFSNDAPEAFATEKSQETSAAETTTEATAADSHNQLASEPYDSLANEVESDAGGNVEAIAADSQDQLASETSETLAADESQASGVAETVKDVVAEGAVETQALATSPDEHATVRSDLETASDNAGPLEETPERDEESNPETSTGTESDEQVAFHSEQGPAEPAATESDERAVAASDTQALIEPEPDPHVIAHATADQQALVEVQSEAKEVALQSETALLRPGSTEFEERFISAPDEQAGERSGSSGQVSGRVDSASDEIADEAFAAVEEHVVPEHLVEENVVPEHELSVSDDSVTESSSEADNSDAEPSR